MSTIRLKRDPQRTTAKGVVYTEGYFGGLFRNGLNLEVNQLKQRFRGQIPDTIDIEITAPGITGDEGLEIRREYIQAKRQKAADDAEEMQIQGAIERIAKKMGKR